MHGRWLLIGIALAVGLAVALVAYTSRGDGDLGASPGSTRVQQASAAQLVAAGLSELPLAPEQDRVDLTVPAFSDPANVTNPLFPISDLHSAVLLGTVDGGRFRAETTLLPETRVIEWPEGRIVEVLVSQYVAYLDGRIEEVALDYYAQADDGSVWYFGEDVFNYRDGVIVDTDGTWLAGKEGPAAMIMPADPQVGDVYRPENIPGLVFEEVRVKAVGRAVSGPHGPVAGAMIAEELHQDGTREDKTFAPGYGEFFTGSGGDVEAMAIAVPADRLAGPLPAELETLSAGADDIFDLVRVRDWTAASATARSVVGAWERLQADEVPARLAPQMGRALRGLAGAVGARDTAKASHTAIEVAQAALDLELRYRPLAEIDRARFELWTRQLLVDAAAEDAGGVRGDLATLEWIRDRFVHTLDRVDVTRIDARLVKLRASVGDDDLLGAAAETVRLRRAIRSMSGS